MIRRTRTPLPLLLTVPAALTLVAGVPTAAGAAPAASGATGASFSQVIGSVVIDADNPEVAYVTARYRCTGQAHVWVSVKQTADRTADPRLAEHGSSQISAAWSDTHRPTLTCDGTTQLQTFEVDQLEPLWSSQTPKSAVYDPLAPGKGYVQFCLYDETTGEEGASDDAFRTLR